MNSSEADLRPRARFSPVLLCCCLFAGQLLVCGCTDEAAGPTANVLADSSLPPDGGKSEPARPVPSKEGPWPKLVVPETDFSFGRMRVGTKQTHEFELHNEGEAELQLTTGKTTCKCTRFELSSKTLAPGDSATLLVEWHGKFAGKNFQHGGRIYSNDPAQPEVRINVQGIVDNAVATSPAGEWHTGAIANDEPHVFEGVVYSTLLPKLTIEEITASSEFVAVETVPYTEQELKNSDGQPGFRVRVTIRPEFPAGELTDTITVRLAEVEEPLEIPLRARRDGDIRINAMRGTRFNPQTRIINLGQFPAAKGRKAELMLIVDQKSFTEELQLLEVDSSPKLLRAVLEPIGAPTGVIARYKLTVEVPSGGVRVTRNKDNLAWVRCRTNHPEEGNLELRVSMTTH